MQQFEKQLKSHYAKRTNETKQPIYTTKTQQRMVRTGCQETALRRTIRSKRDSNLRDGRNDSAQMS